MSAVPLWSVVALTFVGVLAVSLVATMEFDGRRARRARSARVAELARYRVVRAYAEPTTQAVDESAEPGRVASGVLSAVDGWLRRSGRRDRLVERLDRAGMRVRPEEWVATQLAAVLASAAVGGVLTASVFGAAAGLLGWAATSALVRVRTRRRAAKFEAQVPDALALIAGALHAGFAVNQAVAAVVRDAPEPAAGEFARALQEVRLGDELEDALHRLAERMDSSDLVLVAMAIRTVRDVGGNLAETLQNTAATMRERTELRGQVRVLTAEGRLSAKVLTGLPFLMAVYMFLFRRDYLQPMLSSAPGIAMLAGGAVLLGVGAFWLSRLTKLEV